jgi:enoyl-CoA hydratase
MRPWYIHLTLPRDALQRRIAERADRMLAAGLVDEVVDPPTLMERATTVAERMSSVPAATYALTKEALRAPVLERVEASAAYDEKARRLWTSPEVRDLLKVYLERLSGS